MEALLNEREVAALLKVSVATIRRRRLFRQPPNWVKLGASVRYRPESIRHLIETAESATPHSESTRDRKVPSTTRQATPKKHRAAGK